MNHSTTKQMVGTDLYFQWLVYTNGHGMDAGRRNGFYEGRKLEKWYKKMMLARARYQS